MSLDPTSAAAPVSSPTVRVPDGPAGLLLGRDLFFNTRITGTAEALGHRVVVAGSGAAVLAHLRAWAPVVVFVDLAAGDLVASPSGRTSTRRAWPPRRPPGATRSCRGAGSPPSCPR